MGRQPRRARPHQVRGHAVANPLNCFGAELRRANGARYSPENTEPCARNGPNRPAPRAGLIGAVGGNYATGLEAVADSMRRVARQGGSLVEATRAVGPTNPDTQAYVRTVGSFASSGSTPILRLVTGANGSGGARSYTKHCAELCDLPDLSTLIAPRPQFVESGISDTPYPHEPAYSMTLKAY